MNLQSPYSMLHAERLIEAVLFASPDPVKESDLNLRLSGAGMGEFDVVDVLKALGERYCGRGIELVHRDKAWAFRTAPDLATHLHLAVPQRKKLSRAAMETLAIIAYHQPITRAEIENMRGVALSRGTLDVLLEADWVRPVGRRQSPGRPMTWGTTQHFLDTFNLENLAALPGVSDLKSAGFLDVRPAMIAYAAKSEDDLQLPLEDGSASVDDLQDEDSE